jgi:predicted transcriptional regulator YheO
MVSYRSDGTSIGASKVKKMRRFLGWVRGSYGDMLLDAKKVQIAQALYNDKANSIADISRTLRISRSTLYRYVESNK